MTSSTLQQLLEDLQARRISITSPQDNLYHRYAESNEYPSPDDLASINAEMQAMNARLNDISLDLVSLKTAIATLEAEATQIKSFLPRYSKLLRPIQSLPRELLSEIFILCVRDRDLSSSSVHPRSTSWVLGQVCRAWRVIALETPCLWTNVSIRGRGIRVVEQQRDEDVDGYPDYDPDYEEGYPVYEEWLATEERYLKAHLRAKNHRLALQLQRSGSQPLSITAMGYAENQAVEKTDANLQVLCSNVQRWRSLCLELNPYSLPNVISQVRGLLPELVELHLIFEDDGQIFRALTLDWFEFAPKLQKLQIDGCYDTVKLPLSQILDYTWFANFYAGDDTWTPQQKFLRSMPNLKRCRVVFNEPTQISDGEPQTLLRVTELELYTRYPRFDSGVQRRLSSFITPSVTSLTISTSGADPRILIDFLAKHQNITSLKVYRVEMPSTGFAEVLSVVSSKLTHLSFGVDGGITNAYLALFGVRIAGTMIVPHLEELLLIVAVDDTPSSYNRQTLDSIIQTRSSRADGCLRLVQLDKRSLKADRADTLLKVPDCAMFEEVFRRGRI